MLLVVMCMTLITSLVTSLSTSAWAMDEATKQMIDRSLSEVSRAKSPIIKHPNGSLDDKTKRTIDRALERADKDKENLLINRTTNPSLDSATKEAIDRSLQKVKEEKLSLFSEKRCKSDCLGQSFKETEIVRRDDDLIVFVSNAMPKQALRDLATMAKTHKNIRLVIQGMIKGSMLESAKLVEEIGYPLDIDPKLFETNNITHVPVFMKQKEGKTYVVRGNVTLAFAIEKIEERS